VSRPHRHAWVGGHIIIAKDIIVTDSEPQDVEETAQPSKPKRRRTPIPINEHGFRVGNDSARIVDILIAGGVDRQDVTDRIVDAIGTKTRNGGSKNIPSLVSGLLARLEERGYYIESSWRLVPPSESHGNRKAVKNDLTHDVE